MKGAWAKHGWQDHEWQKHEWMAHHPMMPIMLPSKAAFFQFRRGGASITIKCAEDEPTETCVKAAISLMHALHAEQHGQSGEP